MYDDLHIWFTLIQRFVSFTAFIEDGRVYTKEAGIVEMPMYDAATVLSLMNRNAHLLDTMYRDWRALDTEFRVERSFCVALFEQCMKEDAIKEQMSQEQIEAAMQPAIQSIIDVLSGMGFQVLTSADDLFAFPTAAKPQEELFQSALFTSLDK